MKKVAQGCCLPKIVRLCFLLDSEKPGAVRRGHVYAGVVKLVDALDSKSSGLTLVSVRFRPPVPSKNQGVTRFFV